MESARKTNAWSSAIDTDCSAAQPAPAIAAYIVPGTAAQHALQGPTHKLAFYNVGWASSSKKHKAAWLAREVSNIVTTRNVDAIGISEVFNQRENLEDRREVIMSALLGHLNQGSAEQPAREGRTDAHYIFIWNSNSLRLVNYEVVSCGIREEPSRRGQYFEFQPKGTDVPLHVYHNHSPSTRLTLGKRKTLMKTFWNHVSTKTSVAQPAVIFGGDFNCTPIQWTICVKDMQQKPSRKTVQSCQSKPIPRQGDNALVVNAIAFQEESGFGKSYDSNAFTDTHDVVLVPLCLCNKGTHSSVVQPASNPRTEPGSQEAQPPCPVSTKPVPEEASASAAQPKKLEQLDQQKTSKASNAAQTVSNTSMDPGNKRTHSSVVQPASNPRTHPGVQEAQPPCPVSTTPMPEEASASAAQPKMPEYPPGLMYMTAVEGPASSTAAQPEEVEQTDQSELSRALSLVIPTSSTPLFSTLLEKLANTDDESIMDCLASICLFGDLQNKPPAVSVAQPDHDPTSPYDRSMRVECLLEKTNEQRELHIARIAERSDARLHHKDCLIFHDEDMKEIMNAWRNQPKTWMKNETLQKLQNDTPQERHQKIKSAFSTMLFSLFGNKSLTDICIRYPVCSAGQPANIFKEFAKAWEAAQNSIQLQKRREQSKPNPNVRLSKKIRALTQRAEHAASIRKKVAEDGNSWYQLSLKDQKLCQEHDDEDIRRQIAELRAQQQPRFEGAASSIARNMTKQC